MKLRTHFSLFLAMICLAVGIILVVVVLLVLKATIGKDVTSSYWATK